MNYKSGQLFQSGYSLLLIITNCRELSCYAYELDTETSAAEFTDISHSWLRVCMQIV